VKLIKEPQFDHLGILTVVARDSEDATAFLEIGGGESLILDKRDPTFSIYVHTDDVVSELEIMAGKFDEEDPHVDISPRPSSYEFRSPGGGGYCKSPLLSVALLNLIGGPKGLRFYPLFHVPSELENKTEVLLEY
jgi:hypothetical protein